MPTLQAFILYEEAIPDSKAEITALQSIAGRAASVPRVWAGESRHPGAQGHRVQCQAAEEGRPVPRGVHLLPPSTGRMRWVYLFVWLFQTAWYAPASTSAGRMSWVCLPVLVSQTVCICAARIFSHLLRDDGWGSLSKLTLLPS